MRGHSETRRARFVPEGAVAAAKRIEMPPKHASPRAMNGLRRRARSERRPLKAREPPRGRPRDATMMRSDDSGAVPPVPMRWSVKLSTYPYKRSEEHTSELQSRFDLVCRLLLEKKKKYS